MSARFTPGIMVLAMAASLAGCADWQLAASDGSTVPSGAFFDKDSAAYVVVRSAKHDIPCESAELVGEGSLDQDWVAQGCGERITYRFFAWAGHTWQPAPVARVALR